MRFIEGRYSQVKLSELRDWEARYLMSSELNQLNQFELAWLEQNTNVNGKLPSRTLLNRVTRSTITHPVIGFERLSHYDPTGNIRFCFGVSTYTHELLLRLGFAPQAIMKAIVIGPGRWRDGREGFHQITIVLADDRRWYAIDQFFVNAIPVKEWFQFYWQHSEDEKLRLYITDAGRFTPDIHNYDSFQMGLWDGLPNVPEEARRRGDIYRGYFRDLYEWLDRPLTENNFDQ